MRVSIDVGYDPQTISTVTEFLRKVEAFIATSVDKQLCEMACKDDEGNVGWALIPTQIEDFEYLNNSEMQEETNNES